MALPVTALKEIKVDHPFGGNEVFKIVYTAPLSSAQSPKKAKFEIFRDYKNTSSFVGNLFVSVDGDTATFGPLAITAPFRNRNILSIFVSTALDKLSNAKNICIDKVENDYLINEFNALFGEGKKDMYDYSNYQFSRDNLGIQKFISNAQKGITPIDKQVRKLCGKLQLSPTDFWKDLKGPPVELTNKLFSKLDPRQDYETIEFTKDYLKNIDEGIRSSDLTNPKKEAVIIFLNLVNKLKNEMP